MRFGRRLQSGAVNSLLLLAGLYLILGGFTLANSMGLQYSPVLHSYYENQPLHLVLLSPFLDHIALLVLSALMLILPLALGLWKRALWLILLSCLLLVLRGIFYFWGAPAVGDILLVLAGFISLATILVFGADSLSLVKKTVGARILIWGCAVLLSVQFLSAFCLLLYPSFPSLAWKPSVWRFVGVETQLFHVLSGLVPILFTLTLFSWVIKPLWSYSRSWGKGGKSLAKQLGFKLSFDLGSEQAGSWNSRLSVMLLFCSLAFSLYCVLYPILLTDSMEQIGWGDLPVYARMLQDIGERGGIEAVPYIFLRFRDRAISLLLMTGVWRVTELSPYLALKSTALLLAPLLTLAAYLFARQAAHDPMVISLTPVFTAVSFHLTVGVGVGLLSNWTGLVVLYGFSALLFRSLKERSWIWGSCATIAMIVLLFTHAYTWGMLMGVLGVFLVLSAIRMWRAGASSFDVRMVGCLIAVNLLADLIKNYALGSVSVAREVTRVGASGLSVQNLYTFWQSLDSTFDWASGFFNNPCLILLALLASLVVLLKGTLFHQYLVSWLVASSPALLLGSRVVQTRILYNLPLQILALIAVVFIIRMVRRHLDYREGRVLSTILVLLVVMVNVNYALRCALQVSRYIH